MPVEVIDTINDKIVQKIYGDDKQEQKYNEFLKKCAAPRYIV